VGLALADRLGRDLPERRMCAFGLGRTLAAMRDTTDIHQISQGLAAAVEAAGASVVRVEGRHRRPSSGIVWSADGVVATADHKIEREEGIRVGLPDGRTVPATLVGRDPRTDVAVLRAEATGLAPITWAPNIGSTGEVKVGHLVLALSRPGETVRASLGIVCASAGEWRTHAGGRIDRWLETDVLHQPGFTGGLLVDAAGRGLGMDDAGLRRGRGLAVPAATLKRVVESILAHGGVRRGYLGIAVQPARLPESAAARHGAAGLLVVAVQPKSPAEQGGLLLGDVLLAVDGKRAADPGVLQSILDEDRVGAEVVCSVLRGGEAREVRLTVGAR
jgi:S1-C subfamily serine protease